MRTEAEIRAEIERMRSRGVRMIREGVMPPVSDNTRIADLEWALDGPPAQSDGWPPDAKFPLGAYVRTKPGGKGAEWEGTICGWYRNPPITPLGYAIASPFHKGAVQIFAETRLELGEKPE